jgi:hypothetical protein
MHCSATGGGGWRRGKIPIVLDHGKETEVGQGQEEGGRRKGDWEKQRGKLKFKVESDVEGEDRRGKWRRKLEEEGGK